MKKAVVNRYLSGEQIQNELKPDTVLLKVQVAPINPSFYHNIINNEESERIEPEKTGKITKFQCEDLLNNELSVTVGSSSNEKFIDLEREKEEIKERLEKLELEQLVDEQKRDSLRIMEAAISDENTIILSSGMKRTFKQVFMDDDNEYVPRKFREIKRLKREREGQETMKKEGLIIEKMRTFCEEKCGMKAKINPKMIGKYKFLQRYYRSHNNKITEEVLKDRLEKNNEEEAMGVKSFGRGGKSDCNELTEEDKTPWIVFKYKIYN